MGYPSLGTLSEVASWLFLFPLMAILLPRFGAEGVAASLAASFAASFFVLLGLVTLGGPRLTLRLRVNETP
jgi:O-antigen/teichoic acid export membrane protein